MTTTKRSEAGLFSALLKYWRAARGLSQLDLATSADVSARHVSFLETGRAKPSEEMILRLAETLAVPLRDQNELLNAAGFAPAWEEPALGDGLTPPVERALERMLAQQEPYPMVVMNRCFDVLRMNDAAPRLLTRFVADLSGLAPPINAYRVLFDPSGLRPFVVDWERTARGLIARLHRDVLSPPQGDAARAVLEDCLAYPDVPNAWRRPDFSIPVEATLQVRLRRGELEVGFLTTLTVFSVPHNVTLEELRIESYFPLDEQSERVCQALAG